MADDNADQGTTPNDQAAGADTPVPDTPAPDGPDAPDGAAAKPAKKAAAKRTAKKTPAKKAATKKTAAVPPDGPPDGPAAELADAVDSVASVESVTPPAKKTAKKAAAKKSAAKKTVAKAPKKADLPADADAPAAAEAPAADAPAAEAPAAGAAAPMPLFQAPEPTPAPRTRRSPAKKAAARAADEPLPDAEATTPEQTPGDDVAPAPAKRAPRKRTTSRRAAPVVAVETDETDETDDDQTTPAGDAIDAEDTAAPVPTADTEDTDDTDDDDTDDDDTDEESGEGGPRRRRRRGGRRRRKSGEGGGPGGGSGDDRDGQADGNGGQNGGQSGGRGGQGQRHQKQDNADKVAADTNGGNGGNGNGNGSNGSDDEAGDGTSRRRRRRRRDGEDGGGDDSGGGGGAGGGGRARRSRSPEDEITSVSGSTRLEAKKQRRREGREAGRRRAPIVSEAEFLARRESVDRVMAIRQREDVIQIGVLEDQVLVEHYVARESQTSLIGNVYLGRVQNVLPSMEAAFIDIGKGRNAVLYAGEVNWSALGHKDGAPRKIESVLSSGQTILVQVTKDPVGHKGARLTSQVSLAGRFLVYVPDGTTSGISRKLPDTERNRLKTLLKEIVPDTAGVIVRTAAEGASEEELTQDVERLKARWEEIEAAAGGRAKNGAPQLLYGEPDLTLKVVRDLFTEDFAKLVISGDDAWKTVRTYVQDVAPDLEPRLEKYDAADHDGLDIFTTYRVDEQIAKALDRKVYLPSGGSLVIDRTEAMTVVDVNTGKFTGSGGNLEETVTKNNLEAAEEVVRQLRLRDIGGIIVVDFIDMVLESNRDLVLRRLVECLGRDRTRHQVAEVTSLGLIQMTRKRIGTGLLEAFSENCQHCQGRGVVVHDMPVEPRGGGDDEPRRGGGGAAGNGGGSGGGRRRGGRGRAQDDDGAPQSGQQSGQPASKPSPAEFAAMAKAERAREEKAAEKEADDATPEVTTEVTTGDPSETRARPETAEQPAADQPPVEPAAPRVVTRTRRGASRPAPVSTAPAEPAETLAPADPAQTAAPADSAVPADEPADEPVDEPAAGPADETPEAPSQPAEPPAPRVVTRARRGVTRTVATAPAETVETSTPAPAPVVAVAPAAPERAPEPPRVVTRTRSRSGATRTAAAATTTEPSGTAAAEPEALESLESLESPESSDETAHVPVKRKGARRR